MKTLFVTAAVIAFASPAFADRDERVANQYRACLNDYGRQHIDRCLEIAYPEIAAERDVMNYYFRENSEDKIKHCRECGSFNDKLSPTHSNR